MLKEVIQDITMQDFMDTMNDNFELLLELYSNKMASEESFDDDAVTNVKIRDNAITPEKIRADSIIGTHIGDEQITTQKIADDAITVEKMSKENDLQTYMSNIKPLYITTNLNQVYPAYSVILYYQ